MGETDREEKEKSLPSGLAVVTGASSGIGLEIARELTQRGMDLLIVAENPEIHQAAEELKRQGAQVEPLQIDLTEGRNVQWLFSKIEEKGRPVDVLALNAGVGVSGDFSRETDLEDELNLIRLNVISTVHLAKLVTQKMLKDGRGRILFTSSIASTMPAPFLAVYGASKAFVQSFAQALRNELKDTPITITSLMPGPTDTEFFDRAGMEDTPVGEAEKDDPRIVAHQGLEALFDGKDHVIAGSFKNKIQVKASAVLPETMKAEMHRKQTEPRRKGAA